MTRTRKTAPPAKIKQLPVRMTRDLYEILSNDAAAAGLSKGEYIRRLIVHSHPVLKPEIIFNDQRILYALGDIGKISSNLNQIAHHLNRSGMVTASLCSDIRNALAELFQMRNEIKKMAGKYRGNC